MAGYVLKITIENTHPPVWRRVVIPEKITFADLHQVIQILFGWQEAHLHDFAYPRDDFRVVMDEEDCMRGDRCLEADTQVDLYLKQYPWIRYTYDFGDCWEHKIVLEKTLEDFQGRNAVLQKLKGDHFMEDSGGYFAADESDRIPADEMAINGRLEQLEFPVFESKAVRMPQRDRLMAEDFLEGKLYEAFLETFAKKLENYTEKERQDLFQTILHAPEQLLKQKQPHESKASRRLGEWGVDTRMQFDQGNSIQLIFQKTPEKMADLMTDWHRVNLEDYCKYLGISHPVNATKKTMAEVVSASFLSHPEYMQMLFSEPELLLLKDYLDALAENKPRTYDDQDDEYQVIAKSVSLGLFRLETLGKQRLIHVAGDAAALVDAVFALDWKSYYKRIDALDLALSAVLMMYGMIDLEHLQECCERMMGTSLDQNEFQRFVYWHGQMNELVRTGDREDTGETIVMFADMEEESLSQMAACADPSLGYKTYSDEEYKAWKQGFFNAIPEWMEYGDLLKMLYDEDDVYEQMADDYLCLISGVSVTDFLEELYESYGEDIDPGLRANLWEVVMFLAVHVPQAGLKGYSRAEYAALTGKPLEELELFNQEKLQRRVNKQTMLCHFPAELQLEMFQAGQNEDPDVYLKCLKRLLKKYKSNEELYDLCGLVESEMMLMNNPGLVEDMLMYEQMAGQMEGNIYPWDEDALDWMKPEIPTYVRDQPKVGRNDPCPCGSGKKYKKCCGRN